MYMVQDLEKWAFFQSRLTITSRRVDKGLPTRNRLVNPRGLSNSTEELCIPLRKTERSRSTHSSSGSGTPHIPRLSIPSSLTVARRALRNFNCTWRWISEDGCESSEVEASRSPRRCVFQKMNIQNSAGGELRECSARLARLRSYYYLPCESIQKNKATDHASTSFIVLTFYVFARILFEYHDGKTKLHPSWDGLVRFAVWLPELRMPIWSVVFAI
jgi:hypothetical protein